MPITRQLTDDELQELVSKGIDPEQFRGKTVTITTPEELAAYQPQAAPDIKEPIGKLSTILRTLKAHAGSLTVGGGGALAGGEAGAALGALGGPLAPITVPVGAILGATSVGLLGSWSGGKLQKAILGEEQQNKLEQEAQEAEKENPLTALSTDIVAGAAASGGGFKPSNIPRAGRAIASALAKKSMDELDKKALQAVILNAGVNPAINSGISLASTGELPSGKDLIAQAAGGALFSGQNPLSRFANRVAGHGPTPDVIQEPTAKETKVEPKPAQPESPFITKDENGQYLIDDTAVKDAHKSLFPKPDTGEMNDVDRYKAMTDWRKKSRIPVEQMRQLLHQDYLSKAAAPVVPSTPPVKSPIEEEVKPVEEAKAASPFEGKKSWIDYLTEGELSDYNNAAQNDELERATALKNLAKQRREAEVNPTEEKSLTSDEFGKAADFERASKEKQAQDTAEKAAHVEAGTSKPVSANTLRITKDSLLPDNLARPSEGGTLFNKGDKEIPTGPQFMDYWTKQHEHPVFTSAKEYLAKYAKTIGTTQAKPDIKPVLDSLDKANYSPADRAKFMGQFMNHLSNLRELEPHIKNGRTLTPNGVVHSTVAAELSVLKNNYPRWSKLAEHFDRIMDEKSKSTTVEYDPTNSRAGYRLPTEGGLNDKVSIPHWMIGDPRVSIHEIAHAATSAKLPSEWLSLKGAELKAAMDKYLVNSKGNESIKELIRTYYEAAEKLGASETLFDKKGVAGNADTSQDTIGDAHGYEMGNLHEFISGALSTDQFQHWLNAQESSVKGKSLWTRMVDAIKHLIGYDVKKGSLLERTLKPIDELMAQERPSNNQLEFTDLPLYAKKGMLERAFKPGVESIKDIDHPKADAVGGAFHKVLNGVDKYIGKYLNPIIATARQKDITNYGESNSRLESAMRWERERGVLTGGESLLKTKEEKDVFARAKQSLIEAGKEDQSINKPIIRKGYNLDKRTDKDTQWPTMTNPQVAEIFRSLDKAKMAPLEKKFIDYQTIQLGMSDAEAAENLVYWKRSIQGSTQGLNNRTFFQSSRKEMSIPLPPEFTRPGFLRNLESFFHRKSMDNSYFQHVESNPDVVSALNEKADAWGNPITPDPEGGMAGETHVQKQLEEFRGHVAGGRAYHNEKAASSLATTMFIGPGTTVHKVLSNIVGMTTYMDNPYQAAKMLGGMLTNARQGMEHAVENGVTKLTARSAVDMLQGNISMSERMQALAHTVKGIYSLGDLTDRWGAGLLQAGFEQAMPLKVARANKGDSTQQMLLKRLDPDYTVGKVYTDKELSFLSSKLVQSITGTGDGRTMPTWMSGDTELSGFFKLSHWGIGQTNRFIQDIYKPALNGNPVPLLTSLFGSAIGGYLIKELREKVQGKKGQIPSLEEISQSERGVGGNLPLTAYNLMASLSYAGFGGMLSQFAKIPFDKVYKNTSQSATFPLDEAVSDLTKTLGEASTAIANDPSLNWMELTSHVIGHLLTSNFQLGRSVYNQLIDHDLVAGTLAEKKKLSDKVGELRRFSMVSGLPYNEIDEAGNQYMNLEQKKFKMEQDPAKAVQQLPKLVEDIMRKYGDKSDVLLSKIKALKQNQYATFPSMENVPLSFIKYMEYLEKLEGPAKAQEALQDFLKHKVINELKSSVVP